MASYLIKTIRLFQNTGSHLFYDLLGIKLIFFSLHSKGEIGDINLLAEFHFYEDILYQDYNYKFPVEGGNEKPGKWYGRTLNHGDGMCSWVLTADDELIVCRNFGSPSKDRPNAIVVDELDHKLKGSCTYDVQFLDGNFVEVYELADKGEHHETQVFYQDEFDLIDLNLKFTTISRDGKETTKKAVVKERISEEDNRIELSNGAFQWKEPIFIVSRTGLFAE